MLWRQPNTVPAQLSVCSRRRHTNRVRAAVALSSAYQGAVATFTAAPGSGPGLREVFGCWNCRAKMWPGQQAALRAFASARQWCVHGVSRILAMTSTSEIRLAGRQRVLAQSICSKSAFTECACAVVWMETLLPLLYGARGGADLASSPPTGFLTGSVFFGLSHGSEYMSLRIFALTAPPSALRAV